MLSLFRRPIRSLAPIGQRQLLNAFWQSFEQEFKPDMEEIQKSGEEVKEEIAFAQAQADRLDRELQDKERAAASRQRSKLGKFIGNTREDLETIKKMQLQQSKRRSSQYFRSCRIKEKILTGFQGWKDSDF
jgi:Skp family chaperone for outer membrane proteins